MGEEFVIIFQNGVEIDGSFDRFGEIDEYDVLERQVPPVYQIPQGLEHRVGFSGPSGSDEGYDLMKFHQIEIEREIPPDERDILESLLIVQYDFFKHTGKLKQNISLIIGIYFLFQ